MRRGYKGFSVDATQKDIVLFCFAPSHLTKRVLKIDNMRLDNLGFINYLKLGSVEWGDQRTPGRKFVGDRVNPAGSDWKIQALCLSPTFLMGLGKETIKKIFSGYGDISDVYMATKKDIHRKNFAFVRFKGVDDEMRLEYSLQGIKCMGSRLEVNVARFERKEGPTKKRNIVGNWPNPPRKSTDSFCDGRTFATVTSRVQQDLPPPPPPPPPPPRC
ncbi:unnamed protein product [Lactuca virosa]|uniref:RRM domain-containing protein n=1 Tax=Lactuca virosa TaxID=75947 RepID=A0AAU9LJU9_9ASTR|nr:unnamed protein product [Lactuca virosa]